MASSETLMEFLVSVGFEIDRKAENDFKNSLRGAVLQAEILASAMKAMAKVVVESVVQTAKTFDELYYASQRTGTSVQNMQALGYAVKQLGGTYEGAKSSLAAFGLLLRTNPGYGGLLESYGISTKKNGHLRDQVEILGDLGKKLATMPYPIAYRIASTLGLDENTMRAIMSGDLQRRMAEYAQTQRDFGLDAETAAKRSHELNQAWDQLGMTLGVLQEKIVTDFGPSVTDALKSISDWVKEHRTEIHDWLQGFSDWVTAHRQDIKAVFLDIGHAISDVWAAVKWLVDELKPLVKGFDELARSLTGKDGLTVAIEAAFGLAALSKVTRFFAALSGGATAAAGAIGTGSSSGLLAALARIGLITGAAYMLTDTAPGPDLSKPSEQRKMAEAEKGAWYNRLGRTLANWWNGTTEKGPEEIAASKKEAYRNAIASIESQGSGDYGAIGPTDPKLGRALGRYQVMEGNIPAWSKEALGREVSVGEFMANPKIQNAIFDYKFGSYIQKYGERGAAEAWFGGPGSVGKLGRTDVLGTSVGGYGNRFMQKLRSIGIARTEPFGDIEDRLTRPVAAFNGSRASASTTQTVNITVHGATDPHATANAIERKQSGITSKMLRNSQGAVR